ncbi:MAG: helix-turn-helix domain-containing protein [Alphaproteobacteria bacterium]
MSRITSRKAPNHRTDQRAARTRSALAQALMTLAPRHGFDALEVRALVAQAGIGRSTFYRHYADKDDFFVNSFADMVVFFDARAREHRPGYTEMLPAREVFGHIMDAREFALSLAASGQVARTCRP